MVTASTDIGPGIEVLGTLPCPGGKTVVGGGWRTTQNDLNVRVIGSAPSTDASGWTGGMYNAGSSTDQLTLFAVCVSKPASSSAVSSSAAIAETAKPPVFTVVNAGSKK